MLSILSHVKATWNTLLLTTASFLCGFCVADEKCRVLTLCKEEAFERSGGFPIAAAQPEAP